MMSEVSAPRREYNARVKERQASEPVEESKGEDDQDGTRSVQELIAAALKLFANAEPKAQPVALAIEVPAIQFAAAPNIEAAVQRVLDQIAAKPAAPKTDDESTKSDEPIAEVHTPDAITVEPQLKTDAPITSKGPVATTAVREPAPLTENPNPSHVHLVLDDGPERVVVTVAVRGNEVNATIRGGDEQTAAAIARNAASLDHALRAGGLDLSSFSSERERERDLDHHTPREHTQREHDDPGYEEEMA